MPAALPIIAVAAMVAGSVVSTVSQVQQAKFQSRVAKMNAKINEQNAERAAFASQVDAQDQDFQARAVLAEEVAAQQGSGLTLRSGSAQRKNQNLRTLARQDATRIVQGGQVESHNFLVRAANNRADASAAKAAGRSALIGGVIGTVGTAASGISGLGGGGSLISAARTTGSPVFNASADVTNFRRLG